MKHTLPFYLVIFAALFFLPVGASAPYSGEAFAKEQPATAKNKKATAKKAIRKKPVRKKQALTPTRRATQRDMQAKYAALIVNADTGQVLYEVNANETRHPASLTKMMTLYLLFEAINKRQVTMDTLFPVSEKAADMPPTNIALTPGDRVGVKTAIESLVIRSANDVAMVVAEALGGSQSGFAAMMNEKARQLGMSGTHFENPSGLPDIEQVTTAYDMARLGIALRRDFPEYYHYFSQDEFEFRGRVYATHNRLLHRFPGADGIKTGYIGMSGFNLVTSVKRGNTRLVAVVMGGRTAASRDQQMMTLLDNTFSNLAREPANSGSPAKHG